MTATAAKYVKVLWELGVSVEETEEALRIYRENETLRDILTDPSVYTEEKHAVIDRIFSGRLQNFMKILCDYSDMEFFEEIAEEYKLYANAHQMVLNATLRYVTKPGEEQLEGIREFLKKECGAKTVEIEMTADSSLIGGFVLSADGREWDWSLKGRIKGLQEKLQGQKK